MSKQSEAKQRQHYTPKLIPSVCCNCVHFRKDVEKRVSLGQTWLIDKSLRCGLGGFAVKKQGSCAEWAGKEAK